MQPSFEVERVQALRLARKVSPLFQCSNCQGYRCYPCYRCKSVKSQVTPHAIITLSFEAGILGFGVKRYIFGLLTCKLVCVIRMASQPVQAHCWSKIVRSPLKLVLKFIKMYVLGFIRKLEFSRPCFKLMCVERFQASVFQSVTELDISLRSSPWKHFISLAYLHFFFDHEITRIRHSFIHQTVTHVAQCVSLQSLDIHEVRIFRAFGMGKW